ncbi:hypothetical protein [Mesorhizobium sp.]|uniref:hypothetical protein n=1 Tax=Mesorhizobium sp. TaxID=1871066 RepID=UPI0012285BA3|nr:hypothetical protein [Mesorhizobium sp.]TIS37548.1 MAG: hypothetical protein E5W95_18225 [Mesorhizobium sp.]
MPQISEAPSIVGPGHNLATTTDILRDRFAGFLKQVDSIADEANRARDALGEGGVIDKDEQRDPLIAIGLKAGKLSKTLDETRLSTTKPLRDEVSETNKFFEALAARMDKIKTRFEEIVGVYDRKKRDEERRRAAEAARLAQEEADRKFAEAQAAQHSVVSDVIMNEAVVADQRAERLAAVATTAGTGPTKTESGTISSSAPWTCSIDDWSKLDITEFKDQFSTADIEKAVRAHVRKFKNTRPLKGVKIFQDEKTRFRG